MPSRLTLIPIEPQPVISPDGSLAFWQGGVYQTKWFKSISNLLNHAPHRVGDKLPVKEACAFIPGLSPSLQRKPHYFADGPLPTVGERHDSGLLQRCPAAEMPDWAVRRWKVVTRVKAVQWKGVTPEMIWEAGHHDHGAFMNAIAHADEKPITLTPETWLWAVWAEEQEQQDG